jgi:hypothetical protein
MDDGARALLVELLDRGFNRASWHGANLMSSLRGVDAATAARQVGRRKTIWEQALHAAYWKQRVINKVVGKGRFARKGSNWPIMPKKADRRAWREDLALLARLHAELRRGVVALAAEKLTPRLVFMIQGAAFHDVYHAGQIKLLRRMMERSR